MRDYYHINKNDTDFLLMNLVTCRDEVRWHKRWIYIIFTHLIMISSNFDIKLQVLQVTELLNNTTSLRKAFFQTIKYMSYLMVMGIESKKEGFGIRKPTWFPQSSRPRLQDYQFNFVSIPFPTENISNLHSNHTLKRFRGWISFEWIINPEILSFGLALLTDTMRKSPWREYFISPDSWQKRGADG